LVIPLLGSKVEVHNVLVYLVSGEWTDVLLVGRPVLDCLGITPEHGLVKLLGQTFSLPNPEEIAQQVKATKQGEPSSPSQTRVNKDVKPRVAFQERSTYDTVVEIVDDYKNGRISRQEADEKISIMDDSLFEGKNEDSIEFVILNGENNTAGKEGVKQRPMLQFMKSRFVTFCKDKLVRRERWLRQEAARRVVKQRETEVSERTSGIVFLGRGFPHQRIFSLEKAFSAELANLRELPWEND